MTGREYTIFDSAIGRCGSAWGAAGIIGVQLPEVREIDTRRRLFQLYPDARELRPPRMSRLQSRALLRCCAGRRAISPRLRWI
jgi:methylated-DNA-[protein]-cysteine S-methyltransferase